MLIDIILDVGVVASIIGCIYAFISVRKNNKTTQSEIELFPDKDVYVDNINEDDENSFLAEYGQYMENIAAQKNRGSVRMGIGKCYTPDEYYIYRDNVLSKELP